MRIIAIDPGYGRIGIAVLEKKESLKEKIIFSECLTTDIKKDINNRIFEVGKRVDFLIKKHKVNYLIIEGLFFSKNTKTALFVAEARGVIIFQAINNNIPVHEYTPNQIKVAVAGNGSANKKDIFSMLPYLVEIDDRKRIDDELDAISIGLTFFASFKKNES